MVFHIKSIEIIIPEDETHVHLTKIYEDCVYVFHDNVESLSIDDDCDISIERIKSFGIKNLKNLKLGMMKEYLINEFDNLELLVLPKNYPENYNPVLKIDNPSLKTIVLSPNFFTGRFSMNHDIENFLSYAGKGKYVSLKSGDSAIVYSKGRNEYSCVFLIIKFFIMKN